MWSGSQFPNRFPIYVSSMLARCSTKVQTDCDASSLETYISVPTLIDFLLNASIDYSNRKYPIYFLFCRLIACVLWFTGPRSRGRTHIVTLLSGFAQVFGLLSTRSMG